MTETPKPVLFADIDGTIREGKDDPLGRFVNYPEDVRVFFAAIERMKAWRQAGGRIIGVSNQGGIALGHVTLSDVIDTMRETQRQTEALFDRIAWCRHHPQAADLLMARCWCRKPLPGLAIEAALDLARQHPGEIYPPGMALFVGDRPEDEECAAALNVEFVNAAYWRSDPVDRWLPEGA